MDVDELRGGGEGGRRGVREGGGCGCGWIEGRGVGIEKE